MPLDYESEFFVKLYKRDTLTVKRMGWEGRAVLWEFIRKCDPSGVIEVGDHGIEGLAVLLDIPPEVTERAVAKLCALGTMVACEGGMFVLPRFWEAQAARPGGKVRQQQARDRRREEIETKTLRPVKVEPVASARHVASQDATNQRESAGSSAKTAERVTKRHADPDLRDETSLQTDLLSLSNGSGISGSSPPEPPDSGLADLTEDHCTGGPTIEPEPARDPVVALAEIAPTIARGLDRNRLVVAEVWAYGREQRAVVAAEIGVEASARGWPGLPMGVDATALSQRLLAILAEGRTHDEALAELKHVVDVAVAEARRADVRHLRWFTAGQVWDETKCHRARQTELADAATPKPARAASKQRADVLADEAERLARGEVPAKGMDFDGAFDR